MKFLFNFFLLIIITGCNPDPIFPLSKKNISNVAVKNFSIAKLDFPKDGYISVDENQTVYDYEPDEETILADLLPRGVATQIFSALLENGASEQGARMSAMDNATRNAGEMIDKLTIEFNRSRQAVITNELIEIISGAEAL